MNTIKPFWSLSYLKFLLISNKCLIVCTSLCMIACIVPGKVNDVIQIHKSSTFCILMRYYGKYKGVFHCFMYKDLECTFRRQLLVVWIVFDFCRRLQNPLARRTYKYNLAINPDSEHFLWLFLLQMFDLFKLEY